MPQDIIERVGARGERAGQLLAARYAPTPGKDPKTRGDIVLTWDNHRWVRYRSFIAALELVARRFHATWADVAKQKPSRSYHDLLHRPAGSKPASYPLGGPGQQQFVFEVTDEFITFVDGWGINTHRLWERLKRWPLAPAEARLAHDAARANDPRAERGV